MRYQEQSQSNIYNIQHHQGIIRTTACSIIHTSDKNTWLCCAGAPATAFKQGGELSEPKESSNTYISAMKSFLEDIADNGIAWNDAATIDEVHSSSDSSASSSDDDDDDDDGSINSSTNGDNNQIIDNANMEDDVEEAGGDNAQDDDDDDEEYPLQQEAAPNDPLANTMYKLRNHHRHEQLLFRVARSEELPLVRAEIDWDLLTSELSSYPASHVGDEFGSILLQGILRMDPPLSVVRETLRLFQKSCVDMKSFDVACQYACDDVVRLVMHRTMQSRRLEGIKWDMLAFLGDARIQPRHAKLLLQSIPEAVTDPEHGLFGVSPLDRMMSGAFIHGGANVWVEKLKLALITAEYGLVDSDAAKRETFFPFHALIRRLIAQDFMGVKFGPYSFVQTLAACVRSEEAQGRRPFHTFDYNGHLPLHVALSKQCITNLGVLGERKLMKFLLNVYPQSAVIMTSAIPTSCAVMGGMGTMQVQRHPLRMSIENGWPCYDIIADAVPNALSTPNHNGDLLLHIALSGPYHARFGITGARKLVKYFLRRYPQSASIPNGLGKLPLHLALECKWPCHDILMAAYPQAVETKDTTSRFYPFQIAACSSYQPSFHNNNEKTHDNGEEQCSEQNTPQEGGTHENKKSLRDLSILYELIRESPPLLAHAQGASSPSTSTTSSTNNNTDQPINSMKGAPRAGMAQSSFAVPPSNGFQHFSYYFANCYPTAGTTFPPSKQNGSDTAITPTSHGFKHFSYYFANFNTAAATAGPPTKRNGADVTIDNDDNHNSDGPPTKKQRI